jgi:hypothetical protein
MTKPTRLNILISRPAEFMNSDCTKALFGPSIYVRYGYQAADENDAPTGVSVFGRAFASFGEVWSPDAINSLGNEGAYVNVYPVTEMRAFVAELRAAWGELHVQDNSGLLRDLHQGVWVG